MSSRTPAPTRKPSWTSSTSGSTASAPKVAGEHQPGRGDHPAGDRERGEHAAPGALARGLLARPGHQEDVVVDPEGHEEHERDQHDARVADRAAQQRAEEQGAEPDGRGEASTTVATSSSGATSGAQQQREHHGDDQQHGRHHDPQVAAVVSRVSSVVAVSPPTRAAGSTPRTAVRSARTVSSAASLSAGSRSVASSCTRPSTSRGAAPADGGPALVGHRLHAGDPRHGRGGAGDVLPGAPA